MKKKKQRIAWHYTYGDHIYAILKSGALLPPAALSVSYGVPLEASIRQSRGFQADERLLLFSENPLWEPASFRGVQGSDGNIVDIHRLEDYGLLGITVHRIAVATHRLKPYSQLLREVHMPAWMARGLDESARRLGSNPTNQWWGTTNPVAREQWLSVESYEDGIWGPYINDRNDEEAVVREFSVAIAS